MFKLFIANLKMMVRGRQALFWALMFPLMFTVIFGFFFGGTDSKLGTIALINKSNTEIAQNLEKAMEGAKIFKIRQETNLEEAKKLLSKSTVATIVEVPENFGALTPDAPKEIIIVEDPANSQVNAVVAGFLREFTTQLNYQIQKAKPIYNVKVETTSAANLNYFDFVLIGLIGMALMNGSIQGIAISMAKYREDKILKRITTTPLRPWKFVGAEVVSRLFLNLFQIGLVLSIGIYFFHAHIDTAALPVLILLGLLGGLLFQSIGFAVSAVARTTDAAQGMAVAISVPMMFLAGVFFPIDQLPLWLYSIVKYLPLAPLLRMLRQVGLEDLSPFTNPNNVVIVIAWIIIALAISIWRFRLSDE